MNNRVFLVLIIILSCAILLVGGTLIGAALALQGNPLSLTNFTPQNNTAPLLTQQDRAGAPDNGAPAPDFTVSTTDGKTLKLSDFRGKPVMINFWASWCGPCTAEMKNIEAVFQQHLNDDFVILAVNQGEGSDTIKGYGELWKLNFRLVHDDNQKAAELYHVQALPTTVFVDREGKVYEVHIGGPMTQEFIEKRANALLEK
jgi:cytochrome c biogenesis protein CcmG, thiol:disulfide interchange protein DsbE